MTALHWEDLDPLLETRDGPCVSLYMPTHRRGREIQQDPIRLKNLLRKAEAELASVAIRGTNSASLLAPARNLLLEPEFWEHGSDGLAVFLARDFARFYRVPAPFRERVVVSGAFNLKQLLPLLSGDGQFYVLAISQNAVRLLQGTRFGVDELDPAGMPRSLEEALWVDDPERTLQHHGGGAGGTAGRRTGIHHGHGGAAEVEKTNLLRYFQRVDAALIETIGVQSMPLVLAAVDSYFAIYREASHYPRLMEDGVKGNPDELSVEELHRGAWTVVEPLFQQEQDAVLTRYRALAGQGKTSDNIADVVPAAHHGRIEVLFVALGEQCWGSYIPADAGSVVIHDTHEYGDQDLLDVAATLTIKNGGRVFALGAEEVPGRDSPIAAIYRY